VVMLSVSNTVREMVGGGVTLLLRVGRVSVSVKIIDSDLERVSSAVADFVAVASSVPERVSPTVLDTVSRGVRLFETVCDGDCVPLRETVSSGVYDLDIDRVSEDDINNVDERDCVCSSVNDLDAESSPVGDRETERDGESDMVISSVPRVIEIDSVDDTDKLTLRRDRVLVSGLVSVRTSVNVSVPVDVTSPVNESVSDALPFERDFEAVSSDEKDSV
jgi:hypothetical protein